jgi:hypothetical protein
VKCRVYDTECINDRFCRARDACCAGDMECVPLKVDDLSTALDKACAIALEWIELGIPDEEAENARADIQALMAIGTGRECTCKEDGEPGCEVHP